MPAFKKTTYDSALHESLTYFNGDELAAKAFLQKYALRDNDGNILESNPEEMHKRLAREFARIEARYPNPLTEEEILGLFRHYEEIVPQGSPMSAIGNPFFLQSLSNCFVIPSPYDSYAGICKTDQEEAQIMKRRGGVGFDISPIRPRGLSTKNAARTTDGIAVFMERFSNTCREVAQNGRRGALMLSIDCHHPEILTFINIKRDRSKVTGANISIKWSDEFLNAVESNGKVQLRWPVEKDAKYEIEEWVDAKPIWDAFVEAAWECAEPGCLFWDTAIRRTPSDCYAHKGYRSVSTNPCGEIILSIYDSCRLMLLPLLTFIDNPFTAKSRFNVKKFTDCVIKAQRLMDDLVDLELEAIDKIIAKVMGDKEPDDVKRTELELWKNIRAAATNGRRTGLGLTAVGDAIAALGMRYGSKESIEFVEEAYKALSLGAYTSSVIMAKERGAFPIWDAECERGHPFLEQIWAADPVLAKEHTKYGRRNIALTTTAPAGTVSTQTQTTSGIEPAIYLEYVRRRKINPGDTNSKVAFVDHLGDSWEEHSVYHHGFAKWKEITGQSRVEDSPYYKSTANEIDWEAGVELQAAAQKWICHAISKTTNLPADASKEVVSQVYWRGWKTGCKGITVYREGSRSGVLISDEEAKKQKNLDVSGRPYNVQASHAPKRPERLPCEIHHVAIKGVKWVILVGLLEDRPYEIFAGAAEQLVLPSKLKQGEIVKVKQGHYNLHVGSGEDELIVKNIVKTFDNPESAWATRMVSLSLRHGVDISFVVEQLNKDGNVTDVNKVLSRVLKKYIPEGKDSDSEKCPSCGQATMVYQEGCKLCKSCSYSKC